MGRKFDIYIKRGKERREGSRGEVMDKEMFRRGDKAATEILVRGKREAVGGNRGRQDDGKSV